MNVQCFIQYQNVQQWMAVCRTVFVTSERDAVFNQTAPRYVSRLLFLHHPHHVPNPNPVSKTMTCFLFQSTFWLEVGRDLKIRQTYVQIVNFPNEVHTETPREETRLIFVYSGLCARDIIHNIPSFDTLMSTVMIKTTSLSTTTLRSSCKTVGFGRPCAARHWIKKRAGQLISWKYDKITLEF